LHNWKAIGAAIGESRNGVAAIPMPDDWKRLSKNGKPRPKK
jgi:hypothetical protein